MDNATLGMLFQLFLAVMLGVIASSKGLRPLYWVLSGGIIGIIVLFCQPSAKEEDIDEPTRAQRVRKGNRIGAYMSLFMLIGITAILLLNFEIIHVR